MFEVFGLKVNFDVQKIESGNYGYECWKVFWSCFDMNVFKEFYRYPTFDFLSGDQGNSTFVICMEALAMRQEHETYFDEMARKLNQNPAFTAIAQDPGIERYSNSMLMDYYSPFIKTLSIGFRNVETDNEDIAHSAIEALNLYRE